MILGVGTDIVDITHFKKALQQMPSLLKRVFTKAEQQIGKQIPPTKRIYYYAKRFAAKEAISKACGTGIGGKISWLDIKISNTAEGQPVATLSLKASAYLKKHYNVKNIRLFLSLSDEKNTALAFALLETD